MKFREKALNKIVRLLTTDLSPLIEIYGVTEIGIVTLGNSETVNDMMLAKLDKSCSI